MRIVAVISVFTILTATTVPAFADNKDDVVNFLNAEGEIVFSVPSENFVLDDYVIPYDDYLELMSGNGTSTYSLTAGLLGFSGLAWGAGFAEAGLICAKGAIYLLGILIAGGSIAIGADGLYDTVKEGDLKSFYDAVVAVYNGSSAATKSWLDEAWDLYSQGKAITIPVDVSVDVSELLNGKLTTDGAGNGIDTSLSVDTSIIGGAFDTTFPDTINLSNADNIEALLTHFDYISSATAITSVVVGGLTLTKSGENYSQGDGVLTITNNTTGASLEMSFDQFNYGRPDLTYLSKFYKVVTATCSFWTLYGAYSSSGNASPYTPEKHTKYLNNTMTFKNTGTILDGLVIGGVVWDSIANMWRYVIGDCNSSTTITEENSRPLPIDPIGLVMSNTGVNTAPGITWPGTDTKTESNKKDNPVGTPMIPLIPWDKAGELGDRIGLPVSDDSLADANTQSTVASRVDADVLEADKTLDFTDLATIKDFIGNIKDYFTGLFGWLPDDFENKLDGVWVTLGVLVIIIIGYKFIT